VICLRLATNYKGVAIEDENACHRVASGLDPEDAAFM
jgi:hypothetical protein